MILEIKHYQSTKHTNTWSFKHYISFLVYTKTGHHQRKYTEGKISITIIPMKIVDRLYVQLHRRKISVDHVKICTDENLPAVKI